jgi:ABC-type proline/glycine betaine transport system permease subunit
MILSPQRNITLPSLEALNAMVSFVYVIDLLYLVLQVPASLLGLVLNIPSLIVFSNKSKFNTPLYFYA